MIFNSVDEFLASQEYNLIQLGKQQIIATSGGFAPLHVGHVRCILETATLAESFEIKTGYHYATVIIVNSDEFLIRKKNFVFMNHAERMEIVDAIKGVDYTVGWEDGSQTVVGALEKIRPAFFTKGGDRSQSDQVPEVDVCRKIGCQILYGIGGVDKAQSSSNLIKHLNGDSFDS